MKTRPYFRPRHGFTLIELLVVISIIMVLAAMSFTVITLVTKKKNHTVTLSNVSALSGALDQYFDTYHRLPNVGSQDELTADGQAGTQLLKILLGKEDYGDDMQNPRGLVFLTAKFSDNKKQGGVVYNGSQLEGMYDAWGRPLHIKFDSDVDGEIPDPTKPGGVVRQKNTIVWSFGADGKVGDNDEVKSW